LPFYSVNLEIIRNTIIKDKGIGVRIEMKKDAIGPVLIQNNVISAPQPYRVPDDARIAIKENEVKATGARAERERFKQQALLRWSDAKRE
jgi:hypothetical protein